MRVPIDLANPDHIDHTRHVDQAVVDTGATWTALPRSIADQLGLRTVGRIRLRTAAGPQEFDQSFVYIKLQGKSMVTPVVLTDTYGGVLIGVTTLESLGFAVDPTRGTLIDAEILLL